MTGASSSGWAGTAAVSMLPAKRNDPRRRHHHRPHRSPPPGPAPSRDGPGAGGRASTRPAWTSNVGGDLSLQRRRQHLPAPVPDGHIQHRPNRTGGRVFLGFYEHEHGRASRTSALTPVHDQTHSDLRSAPEKVRRSASTSHTPRQTHSFASLLSHPPATMGDSRYSDDAEEAFVPKSRGRTTTKKRTKAAPQKRWTAVPRAVDSHDLASTTGLDR